jgi:hypothetical protein
VDYLKNTYIQNQFLLIPEGPLERIRRKIETVREDVVERGDAQAFLESDFAITTRQIGNHLNISDGRASDYVIRLAEKFVDPRGGAELRQKVADYLNTKVSGVIQRSMKLRTADFQKLFASLRKTLKQQGMNLTLFIEDINSFTGIDEALMEVLLTNHEAEGNDQYCRLVSVVGSTTAFYRDKLNASIKGRIKSNIYILNKAVLGNQAQLAVFAAKYINAINISDAEVAKWYDNGAQDDNIPVFVSPHKWADVDVQGVKMSVFPFNETALWKLFDALLVEKKTPRVLLSSIIAHVLKLWVLAPTQFLLSDSNFSNAEIHIPRWESTLHSEANTAIDPNTAGQRGILLRLWGDGTTKRESGRLGGLTMDVFKAFGVYADITGEPAPKASAVQTTVPTSVSAPKPAAQQPAPSPAGIRPEKLILIENDLDDWLNKDSTLKNHVELRDLLHPFLASAVDWELEGVPQLLVANYLSSSKRVHIEGQNVSLEEGLVLPRNKESHAILTALANWRYAGNRTWNFEGGCDYLVTALAWVERHRQELIDCVRAPQGRADNWNLPLWHVAAVYAIKVLFGRVDIMKTDEEIAVALLGESPDFNNRSVHSEAWNKFKESILNSEYKDRFLKETLALFSKSVGSAEAGETRYTFVDAEVLIRQVSRLRYLDWNLDGLCPADIPKTKNTWYLAAYLVNVFTSNIGKMIDFEKRNADRYLDFFTQALDGDFGEEALADSIDAIRGFLQYLTNTHNLSYADEDYTVFKRPNAPKQLALALARVESVKATQSAAKTLMILSDQPFDEIEPYNRALVAFNNLLNEKEKLFKDVVDTASMKAIDDYKSAIQSELSVMAREVKDIGGAENGNH